MKLFSKLNENRKQEFLVDSKLRLKISAENEGEAGYISDSILSGIEEVDDYEILNIGSDSGLNESVGYPEAALKGWARYAQTDRGKKEPFVVFHYRGDIDGRCDIVNSWTGEFVASSYSDRVYSEVQIANLAFKSFNGVQ